MMGSSAFPLLPGEKATGIQLSAATMAANGGDLQQLASSDPRVPLFNLSILGRKMDSLSRFLSQSVLCHASLGGDQLQMVSTEIATAVQQIIVNGAALLASSQADSPARIPRKLPDPIESFCLDLKAPVRKASDLEVFDVDGPDRTIASKSVIPAHNLAKSPDPIDPFRITNASVSMMDLKSPVSRRNLAEIAGRSSDLVALDMNGSDRTISSKSVIPAEDLDLRGVSDPRDDRTAGDESDSEVMEIDAVELLAEHVHFCEICGKGFKRDANLRMHMRAHGNRFKTLEALSKPDQRFSDDANRFKITRFACPVIGCNRNRAHSRFRPLKSVICVKNHFKRSHCPKMYSCNRCNKKSFSVLADLKSHMKHCGESRWRCSCGTSFSRKDKLFGHVVLFEGHMPAFMGEDEVEGKGKVVAMGEEEEEERGGVEAIGNGGVDPEFFDGFMVGFESGDGWCLDGIL